MKSVDLKAFRKANNISQVELAEYLGVGQPFISQIEKGIRPIPQEYISRLLANQEWDCSMIQDATLSGLDYIKRDGEITSEQLRSAVEKALNPDEKFLIGYLERKVNNLESKIDEKDALIYQLYQQIGMLEAKLDLARKGEIASVVGGSSSADAV